MYFCDDIDLLVWEPSLFLQPTFEHQALIRNAPGTLTAASLATAPDALAGALPGMVGRLVGPGELTQLVELVDLPDPQLALVSGLRARGADAPVIPFLQGPVTLTIVSLRPQIAAVGDWLVSFLNLVSDRANPLPPDRAAALRSMRLATIFGTLAQAFRAIAPVDNALVKLAFYDKLFASARARIALPPSLDPSAP